MADTIVASSPSTGSTGSTAQVQNLLTHMKSTADSIEKGDVLGSAMGVTNVALDIIGMSGDPMGAISQAGVGWVLNAVSFLREPFEILMGSPSAIANSAQSWANAAKNLNQTAQQYRQAAANQTVSWLGKAGEAYRTAATNQANGLEALARASQAVSGAMSKAGQAVAKARQVVLDLINEAVQKIIMICLEALAASWLSFGASIAKGIAQSVQKAVTTAQKLLKQIKEVVDTLQKIIKTVQQILQLVQQVKQLLQQIGGKATSQQQVQPQAQAVGYTPDSSGYYSTAAAGYSGTSSGGPRLNQDLPPAPPTPQVQPGGGATTSPSSARTPQTLPAAPPTPQVRPATGTTPASTRLPQTLPAAPPTPQVRPGNTTTTPSSGRTPQTLPAAPPTPQVRPGNTTTTPSGTGVPQTLPAAPPTPQVRPAVEPHGHQHGPTSQNGWPVNPPRSARTIPGTNVRVVVADGPAGDVLMHVLGQVNSRVEDISMNSTRGERDDWGYAERNVRGSSDVISNHASGTAVDINATRHALGASNTFTPAQTAEIHRILAEVENVVRWGGDYNRRPDEMHFEIVGSQEQVARVAERLRQAQQLP